MKSPKFPFIKSDLEEVINVPRLKSRWNHKVREHMRTQPIPDPIEHLDFHIALETACETIATEVCSGSYVPQVPIRILAEKSKGLCRQLVIPTTKDALVLQTLSDALWADLQKKAPSTKAFYAPQDHKLSKKGGHETEYGSLNAWLKFQKEILGFSNNYEYVIVTDISNYYDFISYDHLRNIIAGLSASKEHALDLLIYTLSQMLWQPDYMPRVAVGLPQANLDGARLLAHCFLFEIDKLLSSAEEVDFTRFMDDIDIGTNSIATAKKILRDLDLALQTRQLRLNSGKTRILSAPEAQRHFRVRENKLLDGLPRWIEKKNARSSRPAIATDLITKAISRGIKQNSFSGGNGDKILKRIINQATKFGAGIDKDDFAKIFVEMPPLRQNLLSWWQTSPAPVDYLELLRNIISSGEIVDDLTAIAVANALCCARLPATAKMQALVDNICEIMDRKDEATLYARLWIVSKYGTDADLMTIIEKNVSVWVTREHLSRLVGGLHPRLKGTKNFQKFRAILERSSSRWATGVFEFHQNLATLPSTFSRVRKFIKAKNPTLPNNITHAKFLMLLSALTNASIGDIVKNELRQAHRVALTDEYYSRLTK